MKDKKARVAVTIPDVLSYILFAILFLVLIVPLVAIRSCTSEEAKSQLVESIYVETDDYYTVSNLLRTSIKIRSGADVIDKGTVGDIIVLWKEDEKYKTQLETGLKGVISSRYQYCTVICIDDKLFYYNDCTLYNTQCSEEHEHFIPDKNGKPIKITLNTHPEPLAETALRYSSPIAYLAMKEFSEDE